MSRKKNLLEAFTRSNEPSAPAPGPAAPREASAQVPSFEGVHAKAFSFGTGQRSTWALGLIGLVLSFVLGFVVGRGSGKEARADEGDHVVPEPLVPPANQPRSFQERARPPADAGAPATPSPDASQSLEESALSEPANLYTVVVASYTKSNSDFAWATYQHLHDARLPVFPPVESRNLVVVLAGAAPTSAELAKTEAAVKALARDGKKKDYPDAYCARIDTLIPRSKGSSKP